VILELATSQLKVHRYEDAIVTLARAPKTPEMDGVRAEALYALGRRDEARSLVEHLLKKDVIPRTLILGGILRQDGGDAEGAIALLKRAVEMQPEDLESRARLSQAYAQARDSLSAQTQLAEMERIKKLRQEIHEYTIQAANQVTSADVRYELGLRYQSLGLIPMAQKWYRAALALDPTHVAARKNLTELSSITPASNRN
jgi:tetratricopeptide (TPR) repeat protein